MSSLFEGKPNALPVYYKSGVGLTDADGEKLVYSRRAIYRLNKFTTLVRVRRIIGAIFLILTAIMYIARRNESLVNQLNPFWIAFSVVMFTLPIFIGYIYPHEKPYLSNISFKNYWNMLMEYAVALYGRTSLSLMVFLPLFFFAFFLGLLLIAWAEYSNGSQISSYGFYFYGSLLTLMLSLFSLNYLVLFLRWRKIRQNIPQSVIDSYNYPPPKSR